MWRISSDNDLRKIDYLLDPTRMKYKYEGWLLRHSRITYYVYEYIYTCGVLYNIIFYLILKKRRGKFGLNNTVFNSYIPTYVRECANHVIDAILNMYCSIRIIPHERLASTSLSISLNIIYLIFIYIYIYHTYLNWEIWSWVWNFPTVSNRDIVHSYEFR